MAFNILDGLCIEEPMGSSWIMEGYLFFFFLFLILQEAWQRRCWLLFPLTHLCQTSACIACLGAHK
ncbi:hypothetical protein BDV28DRAFT_18504 [Aspergillus coremiiformis]|uniref:Uncharacterized protein n=1 Tax=Aspergillus coremiiformis TaxID=138285 RepID=A0A5N6Z1G7_9EURO|nr:hypothetical protein BDV28DRAFT_18504 [Aspergillus coremiiformis]